MKTRLLAVNFQGIFGSKFAHKVTCFANMQESVGIRRNLSDLPYAPRNLWESVGICKIPTGKQGIP